MPLTNRIFPILTEIRWFRKGGSEQGGWAVGEVGIHFIFCSFYTCLPSPLLHLSPPHQYWNQPPYSPSIAEWNILFQALHWGDHWYNQLFLWGQRKYLHLRRGNFSFPQYVGWEMEKQGSVVMSPSHARGFKMALAQVYFTSPSLMIV